MSYNVHDLDAMPTKIASGFIREFFDDAHAILDGWERRYDGVVFDENNEYHGMNHVEPFRVRGAVNDDGGVVIEDDGDDQKIFLIEPTGDIPDRIAGTRNFCAIRIAALVTDRRDALTEDRAPDVRSYREM